MTTSKIFTSSSRLVIDTTGKKEVDLESTVLGVNEKITVIFQDDSNVELELNGIITEYNVVDRGDSEDLEITISPEVAECDVEFPLKSGDVLGLWKGQASDYQSAAEESDEEPDEQFSTCPSKIYCTQSD